VTLARSRTAAALLLGGLLASGLPAAHAVPVASPQGDAKRQAEVLRVRVDALRAQAERATEEYDAAYADLGASVTALLDLTHKGRRVGCTLLE